MAVQFEELSAKREKDKILMKRLNDKIVLQKKKIETLKQNVEYVQLPGKETIVEKPIYVEKIVEVELEKVVEK